MPAPPCTGGAHTGAWKIRADANMIHWQAWHFTVLNYAQHLDVVKVLLANGADPSKRNGYGMDASEYAQPTLT